MACQQEQESQIDSVHATNWMISQENSPNSESQIPQQNQLQQHESLEYHLGGYAPNMQIESESHDSGGSPTNSTHLDEPDSFTSLVEETQFTHVEIDTQPTDVFDMSQGTADAILSMEDIEPVIRASAVSEPFLLGRPIPEPVLSLPGFRFSKAPDPKVAINMRHHTHGRTKTSQARQILTVDTVGQQIQLVPPTVPGKGLYHTTLDPF